MFNIYSYILTKIYLQILEFFQLIIQNKVALPLHEKYSL